MIPALILAGGQGTRLAQTVPNLPKTLAPIQKTPFLHLLLKQLESTGIVSKVVLALGYRASDVIGYLASQTVSLPVEISLETSPLGTGGAILHALDKIDATSFFVMNGDSFFNFSYSSFLEFHYQKRASISIACTELDQASRYGMIKMDSSCRIISFSEKSQIPLRGWINAGIYLMEKEVFSTLAHVSCSLEKDLFPQLLPLGLYGFPHAGTFVDIGTALSYHDAQKTLNPWVSK